MYIVSTNIYWLNLHCKFLFHQEVHKFLTEEIKWSINAEGYSACPPFQLFSEQKSIIIILLSTIYTLSWKFKSTSFECLYCCLYDCVCGSMCILLNVSQYISPASTFKHIFKNMCLKIGLKYLSVRTNNQRQVCTKRDSTTNNVKSIYLKDLYNYKSKTHSN